jgi:putative tricarboxylic transport membrane protein
MGEKIVNGFLFLLSIFYCVSANSYSFGTPVAPKSGFLPQIIGYSATLISGYLFIRSLLGKGDSAGVRMKCDFKSLGCLVALMIAYILIFKPLGYLISTFILLFVSMKIGKVKGWKTPVLVSVLTSGAFYMIFKVFLSVPLPKGIL